MPGWIVPAIGSVSAVIAVLTFVQLRRNARWAQHQRSYECAHQTADRLDQLTARVTDRPHRRAELDALGIDGIVAEWALVARKTEDKWSFEAVNIRRVNDLLSALNTAEDSDDPDWKHRQGCAAAKIGALLAAARGEINRQWGQSRRWRGVSNRR